MEEQKRPLPYMDNQQTEELLFALYRTIRKQAAQHTTNETRRAHTANK